MEPLLTILVHLQWVGLGMGVYLYAWHQHLVLFSCVVFLCSNLFSCCFSLSRDLLLWGLFRGPLLCHLKCSPDEQLFPVRCWRPGMEGVENTSQQMLYKSHL